MKSFKMKPLYCSEYASKNCIKNEKLKPKIFIRTEKLYIFAVRDLSFENIIFDASDSVIPPTDSLKEVKNACSENELNFTIGFHPCGIRDRVIKGPRLENGFINIEGILSTLR